MGMGTGEVTETRNYKSEEIAFDPPSFELFLLTSSSFSFFLRTNYHKKKRKKYTRKKYLAKSVKYFPYSLKN